jgi:hypothetical protein
VDNSKKNATAPKKKKKKTDTSLAKASEEKQERFLGGECKAKATTNE